VREVEQGMDEDGTREEGRWVTGEDEGW